MPAESLILVLAHDETPPGLDGKIFQIHEITPGVLKLYPVSISVNVGCPVIIAGEPCGRAAGHAGKHCWSGGD